jgi:hypothetical protein
MNATFLDLPVYDAASVYGLAAWSDRYRLPDSVPGYLTFFDPGWSIVEMVPLFTSRGIAIQGEDLDEPFTRQKDDPCYRQLRIEAVEESFDKTFDDQQLRLATTDEVPVARVVVAGMAIHYLASGERLFPTYWVRCRDTGRLDNRTVVGGFSDQISVAGSMPPRFRTGWLGLASVRRRNVTKT